MPEGGVIAVQDRRISLTRLQGRVDVVNRNAVRGWAFEPDDPQRRVPLVITANGRALCRLSADRHRPDLEKAGFGDGHSGFVAKLTRLLDPDISYEIRVAREPDNVELHGTPKLLHATVPPRAGPRVESKADVINLLMRKFDLGSYLEICSPTSGFLFGKIDRQRLERCHRIVYHCPDEFDDGEEITWRSADAGIDRVVSTIFRRGLGYDLVFVDSFHDRECSARDLAFAFSVLSPRGLIVMHDASPPDGDLAMPEPCPGRGWCGLSYAALVDFLLLHPRLGAYVVDVDFGVAVVGSPNAKPLSVDETISSAWRALPDDPVERFAFFAAHRKDLLNLISVDDFLEIERLGSAERQDRRFQEIFPVGRPLDGLGRPDLLRELARVHSSIGNADEARRLLELVRAERPDTAFVSELLANLGHPR